MKAFWVKIHEGANKNLIGLSCLTLVFWHIAQTIAFFVTIRLLALFLPVDVCIWSCFDTMSPISYFVSCFSFGLFSQTMVANWPIVFTAMFVVQFFIFVAFGRMITNLTLRFHDSQSKQIKFWDFVKATLLMLPVFVATSMFGYLAESLLSKVSVNSAVSIVVFGAARDIVIMTVFFYFIPVYYFLSQGNGFAQSFKKTVFSSLKILPVIFLAVSIIAMSLNAISFLLLDSRIVSMGIYEPVKFALQILGWATSTVVWFF